MNTIKCDLTDTWTHAQIYTKHKPYSPHFPLVLYLGLYFCIILTTSFSPFFFNSFPHNPGLEKCPHTFQTLCMKKPDRGNKGATFTPNAKPAPKVAHQVCKQWISCPVRVKALSTEETTVFTPLCMHCMGQKFV